MESSPTDDGIVFHESKTKVEKELSSPLSFSHPKKIKNMLLSSLK
jgi:hypothetical protein